jgi:S1-C subfamily serine protease
MGREVKPKDNRMNASRVGFSKVWVVVFAVAAACCSASFAQGVEERGRAIFEKNQSAVVSVQLVVKMKFSMGAMGSEEQETKQEATGFVIDPSGLVVLSLSETDPSGMMSSMMSGMSEEGNQLKVESSLGDVKVLLPGGVEASAKVVLRDKDLDLAFLRLTEKPAKPLDYIDLSQAGDASSLDSVVAIGRLGKVLNRGASVNLLHIEAVVEKPRKVYVPDGGTSSGTGSPVFTLEGKPLGVVVIRAIKDEAGGSMMDLMNGGMRGVVDVILPASDVLDAAKQAPAEAPKEEPKAEPKEESKDAPKESQGESKDAPVIIPNQGGDATPGV